MTINAEAGEIRGKVMIKTDNASSSTDQSHAGAVVYLTGPNLTEKKLITPPPVVILSEKLFKPRVLAVTQGQDVVFKNVDPVHHNVWSLSKAKKFDLGSFKAPHEKTVTFDKPGLVKTFCNIHPGMMGSLLVLKNSFHVTTGPDGSYTIKDIPPGEHTVRVWAEGATPQKKMITVTQKTNQQLDWNIQRKLRSKNHTDKNGKTYKKY